MNAPLHVVGIGPGGPEYLSLEACRVLEEAEHIVGYQLYVALLPPNLRDGKKLTSTGMRHEVERCEAAISSALAGQPTALVCSGDAGIYALASLVLELLEKQSLLDSLPVAIVPGIPALCAAAAKLGAPLTHDFACLSLSDLLTPWELIEKRARCIFEGDFVCVLHNPRSRGRQDHLEKILELAKVWRKPDCPVGLARNISRRDETTEISTLSRFDPKKADMLSLVFIGNSETRILGKYMATPRGYWLQK